MAGKLSQTTTIRESVIRALLMNAPAIMDLAAQLDLTPREVREILHESLLQVDGGDSYVNETIPIVAQLSPAFSLLDARGMYTPGRGRSSGRS